MEESRYEVGKQYLLHNKWLITAVKPKLSKKLIKRPILLLMGFTFDDNEVHENNNREHGFNRSIDGLYYFSNDATIIESKQTTRDNKIEEILLILK